MNLMESVQEATKDIGYEAKRGGLYMAGKEAVHGLRDAIGSQGFLNITALSSIFGKSTAGVVTLGATAAISAGLTEMDFIHERQKLRNIYKEEMESKLNKSPSKLNDKDLYKFAKDNQVVDEHINKLRKNRNFGIGMSFVASLAVLSIIEFAVSPYTAGLHVAAKLAINGAAALISYNVIKRPIHWLVNKLFDIDKETTHDRIMGLQKARDAGKDITPEQVLGVFVKAHPELDEMIESQYGKRFDDMKKEEKEKLAEEMGKHLPLEQLADDINDRKFNVTELAFAVQGERSGVQHYIKPVEPVKPGMFSKMLSKLRHPFNHAAKSAEPDGVKIADTMQMSVEQANALATVDHRQRLGRGKMEEGVAFVERYQREQQTRNIVPGPNTLQ